MFARHRPADTETTGSVSELGEPTAGAATNGVHHSVVEYFTLSTQTVIALGGVGVCQGDRLDPQSNRLIVPNQGPRESQLHEAPPLECDTEQEGLSLTFAAAIRTPRRPGVAAIRALYRIAGEDPAHVGCTWG